MTEALDSHSSPAARVPWWRRWFVDPVVGQLRQGISPEKVALTIALSSVLGIFPVLGSTTILCTGAGFLLRLNQPIVQLVNYAVYPLQLALIFVFIRIGEWVYRAPALPFSMAEMLGKFRAAPGHFFAEFAMTFVHAISAWLLIAPPLAAMLYYGLRPILRAASRRNRTA